MIISTVDFQVNFRKINITGFLEGDDVVFYDKTQSSTFKNEVPKNPYGRGCIEWFDYNRLVDAVKSDPLFTKTVKLNQHKKCTIPRKGYELTINP